MVLMRITGVTAVSVQQNSEVSHALLGLKQVTARARYETKTDLELQKKREELQQGGKVKGKFRRGRRKKVRQTLGQQTQPSGKVHISPACC